MGTNPTRARNSLRRVCRAATFAVASSLGLHDPVAALNVAHAAELLPTSEIDSLAVESAVQRSHVVKESKNG